MTFYIFELDTDFYQNATFNFYALTIKGLKYSKTKIKIPNFRCKISTNQHDVIKFHFFVINCGHFIWIKTN